MSCISADCMKPISDIRKKSMEPNNLSTRPNNYFRRTNYTFNPPDFFKPPNSITSHYIKQKTKILHFLT